MGAWRKPAAFSAGMVARWPGPGGAAEILPAEARESAEDLLRRLLGVPLRTISGRQNLILEGLTPGRCRGHRAVAAGAGGSDRRCRTRSGPVAMAG